MKPSVLERYRKESVTIFSTAALHAKIDVLGNRAAVGSANMSKASRDVLREAVVVLSDPAAVREAREAAETLLEREVTPADLKAAAALYRAPVRGPARPKRPSKEHPAGPPPSGQDRLWVLGLYTATWPATAEKHASAAQRSIRRPAGIATQVEIGSALFDLDDAPDLRPDDVVIEAWSNSRGGTLEEAMHPARVIDVQRVPGRGRSPGWIIAYWRRPVATASVPWADVRTAVSTAGGRIGASQTLCRRVTNPNVHAALRRLWRYPAR